ncbi:MAG: hypothetical protein EOP54_31710, partial [Sphingobacteriales bacterium]
MQTFYKLALITLFTAFTLKAKAQQSLGDPVIYEDFGHGTAYSPVGEPLSNTLTDMPSGSVGGRCPANGAYLILNTSANCFGDTFKTINFDHSDTNPYGYLMMVNGDNKPVAYYHRQISGSTFCAGAKYQFAVFIINIYTGIPRPASYVDPDIRFVVKSVSTGATLTSQATGAILSDSFTEYHVDFNAPADGSDVVISLENNALTGTIGNDFAMDDITVKAYGPIVDAGEGTPTGPTYFTQCQNDGGKIYNLKAFAHNYATPQYQWQVNFNKQGWLN